MNFEILGEIREVEPIAVGTSIRDLTRLRKVYGRGRWRKMKGIAPTCGFEAVGSGSRNCTGMKLMV